MMTDSEKLDTIFEALKIDKRMEEIVVEMCNNLAEGLHSVEQKIEGLVTLVEKLDKENSIN